MTDDFLKELYLRAYCLHPKAGRKDSKHLAGLRAVRDYYTAPIDPEYARRNPLGGPAKVFDAMAARIRAGEEFYSVLDDYGFMVKPSHPAAHERDTTKGD